MTSYGFETMLTGGHPNSLGRTVEVVEQVLADHSAFAALFECYFSTDEVVRLRVSNAMKRIAKVTPELLVPYLDRFLTEIAAIDQASAQWTLAQLFLVLQDKLTAEQHIRAEAHLKHNLQYHQDWIVLNQTMQTLAEWAVKDETLHAWLLPELVRLQNDPRKSVAKRAHKLGERLS